MRILVTGSDGFIGKNLLMHFKEMDGVDCVTYSRRNSVDEIPELLVKADWVFHLAGINRPKDSKEFMTGNFELTEALCDAIKATKRSIPIVLSSSVQANIDSDYGISKRAAEDKLLELCNETDNPVFIYRLPNVFGKFARPNYNSAVATFCHNIARDLPIQINNPLAVISMVYIDDVVSSFIDLIEKERNNKDCFVEVTPTYSITVGELAEQLYRFKASRESLCIGSVGSGLIRALYSTYVSYLPPEKFSYSLKQYGDERGIFVEMLKTKDTGQISFFTAHPGVTRGGHYHHSKIEKFLVIRGKACFRFRHVLTGEFYELYTSGDRSDIVETAAGWIHDVTNVGDEELICMLWANEVFDREKPDTFACSLMIDD